MSLSSTTPTRRRARASRALAAVLCACGLGAGVLTVPAAADAATPSGFFGIVADGPMLDGTPGVDRAAEMRGIHDTGARYVRIAVRWNAMQPQAPGTQIAADGGRRIVDFYGVPTDVTGLDAEVRDALDAGLRVMLTVESTPAWAARRPEDGIASPPRSGRDVSRFVRGLVHRYGTDGDFFDEQPDVPERPVRDWQIWNEPQFDFIWSERPWAPSYVRLALKPAAAAVRAVDPKARVVLAGLTNESWRSLDDVYDAGGRRYFDVVDAHPYSRYPSGVSEILARVRRTIERRDRDTKPMIASEVGFSSADGRGSPDQPWDLDRSGQARRAGQIVRRLASDRRELRLERFFWFTWMSAQTPGEGAAGFAWSGLRETHDGGTRDKPALGAYESAVRKARR